MVLPRCWLSRCIKVADERCVHVTFVYGAGRSNVRQSVPKHAKLIRHTSGRMPQQLINLVYYEMCEHLPAALLYLHPAGFNLAERQTERPHIARRTPRAKHLFQVYIIHRFNAMSTDLLRVCVTHCAVTIVICLSPACLCRHSGIALFKPVGPTRATPIYLQMFRQIGQVLYL